MKKIIVTFFLIIATVVNAQSWWNSKTVKGNGVMAEKKIKIEEFDNIDVTGSFIVNLVDGEEESVTVNGEENILPYLKIRVVGKTLKIGFKNNISLNIRKRLEVTVPFKEIQEVVLSGSGRINSDKIVIGNKVSFEISGSGKIKAKVKADSVKATISGSGHINLGGEAEKFKCNITGSGDIKSYKLKSNQVKALVSGSGDIYVTVTQKIKAKVIGSGNIYYKGDPKHIDSDSLGSGDVIDKN